MAKSSTAKKVIPKIFKEKVAVSFKNHGLKIPITDKEVGVFEKVYGETDFDLPEELGDSHSILEWGAEQYSASSVLSNSAEEIISLKRKSASTKRLKQEKGQKKKIVKLISEVENNKRNDYFKKVVLAAEIAYQLHEEITFGHKKFVKVFFVCKEVCNMRLNTSFAQHAAGPLDSKLMHTIDKELEKQKWFKKVKREKFGFKYLPLENIENYKKYYSNYFSNQKEGIDRIISLFRKSDSNFCEKVATLFAVWKRNLLTNSIISDALLIREFYEWDESKARFTEPELTKAITWMNENDIVPVTSK